MQEGNYWNVTASPFVKRSYDHAKKNKYNLQKACEKFKPRDYMTHYGKDVNHQ